MADQASAVRSSHGSARRAPKNPQQQISQIEKSVTQLLVATKLLLETLTEWSRGTATESDVSDIYVRLGYEFNIASRAFNAIGVETADLGNVPELLRGILEETLSQEASQASLDNFLPRIRDIIINLLHGLKKKQQRLRQRTGREASSGVASASRQDSLASSGELEDSLQLRSASTRVSSRSDNAEDGPDLPPRSSSSTGRASPNNAHSRLHRSTTASQLSTDSSLSNSAAQQTLSVASYSDHDSLPKTAHSVRPSHPADFPPPPPPPPKQEDALAALQRGGELERRASRRFSAYQIQKHLGTNGIPLPPVQNSPIPNRGREGRESMNAVRTRASMMHSRQRSTQQRPAVDTAIDKSNNNLPRRISEETTHGQVPSIVPPTEPYLEDSPTAKTPDDKLATPRTAEVDPPVPGATFSGSLSPPLESGSELQKPSTLPVRAGSRRVKSPSPQPAHFVPEQSPQPGRELTLFLQYKSQIKKYVFADGCDLTPGRLQLAFIEKFAWDRHRNGELPEIHIQDPVSGVRYELEDLNDIKDRAVLVLNVEQLDEVKTHIDEKFGGLSRLVESIKTVVEDQQSTIQRVAERQQQAAKELAGMAAAPSLSSARNPDLPPTRSTLLEGPPKGSANSATSLNEVQSLRRDLAVVRQTYSSFVSDIQASMSAVRTKANAVKSTAVKAALPTLDGDSGRAYINVGKKTLQDDSEKIVNRVDDLQDLVEDLRKDVVIRGVRPMPRQLERTAKDISVATAELKKLQDYLLKEKPLWTKIWEQELQTVCEEREILTMQEELATDLQDDLEKAVQTFELVEQATKQQNLETEKEPGRAGLRSASGRNVNAAALDKAVDPRHARDGVLGEVKALRPNHESRLEAIERAEKARQRELESRNEDEFKRELGNFVEEGKLKKSGGIEEVERLRKTKDERARKENLERELARQKAMAEKAEREAAAAAAAAAMGPVGNEAQGEESAAAQMPKEDGVKGDEVLDLPESHFTIRPWVKSGTPLSMPANTRGLPATSGAVLTNLRAKETGPSVSTMSVVSRSVAEVTTGKPAAILGKAAPRIDLPPKHWARRASTSLRSKTRSGTGSPPSRSHGQAVHTDVQLRTPPASFFPERDADADSMLSITPGMTGKNLANWFSKLLG